MKPNTLTMIEKITEKIGWILCRCEYGTPYAYTFICARDIKGRKFSLNIPVYESYQHKQILTFAHLLKAEMISRGWIFDLHLGENLSQISMKPSWEKAKKDGLLRCEAIKQFDGKDPLSEAKAIILLCYDALGIGDDDK